MLTPGACWWWLSPKALPTRPKKTASYYSTKKKRHTLKAQVIVNQADAHIICTAFAQARVDESALVKTAPDSDVA
jgi:hypothetical protein